MVKDTASTFDGDSDSSSNDFLWLERGVNEPGAIQKEWEAIEHYMYQEDGAIMELKPSLLQECRMWKETFPYLRIIGRRIENPIIQRRQHLREQILKSLTEEILIKLSDLTVKDDEILERKTEESYFERGKGTQSIENNSSQSSQLIEVVKPLPTGATISTNTSPSLDTSKSFPRGILKNSPSRRKISTKKHRENNNYNQSTSHNSFRSSSLPRISSKNNNWLSRSEKCVSNNGKKQTYHQLPPERISQRSKPCTYRTKQLVLPPIMSPTDIKRI